MTIQKIITQYIAQLDPLDLELLIAHALKKSREFILAHPEQTITSQQSLAIKKAFERRTKGEPLAYIVGHKEFYGLDFAVNQNTLIPRPETEQLIELALDEISNSKFLIPNLSILDVGTGSGNIIISLAHELKKVVSCQLSAINFFAVDISKEALKIARKNARTHKVAKAVKFIQGDLLNPLIKNLNLKLKDSNLVILANLPYLSAEIYKSAPRDVRSFEPKTALYSPKQGLAHYERLLKQVYELKKCYMLNVTCYLEISPEQKNLLETLIKKTLPTAKVSFFKDLASKWRIAKITYN